MHQSLVYYQTITIKNYHLISADIHRLSDNKYIYIDGLKNRLMNKAKVPNGKRILITAALPYINNVPHLGHIVGSHLPADIFARYCRIKGHDTLFVGGTDEHGSTSEIAAQSSGIDIHKFCATLHEEHRKVYDWFEISYDIFSRTSNPVHHETTQEFFREIERNGFVSKGTMKVLYSPNEKRFLPDRYVIGTCPHCGYDRASGDQCEKCTALLDAVQLINPRSTTTGDALEVRDANHLFLRLDTLSPQLKAWISKQSQWRMQVRNLAMGWINEGLRERCITRDLKYGVKVPVQGYEDKVFYVWFDAPIGYLSFTKQAKPRDWMDYWGKDKGRVYHFLGKDNIPFHTIFWPGMLIADGRFRLPDNVVGLQYLNYDGGKFSKSQKRGVFCEKLPGAGIEADVLRGALIPLIPETDDTEFKWAEFQQAINAGLLGNYGNFVNRTATFVKTRLGGEVVKPCKISKEDKEVYKAIETKSELIGKLIEAGEIKTAFQEFLALSSAGNKYFEDNKPWAVVKTDANKASGMLYTCVGLCRSLAILSAPFLPSSSRKVWHQLNFAGAVDSPGNWDSAARIALPEKHRIGNPELLYEKLTDEALERFKSIVSVPTELQDYG